MTAWRWMEPLPGRLRALPGPFATYCACTGLLLTRRTAKHPMGANNRSSISFPERIHDELVTAIATRRVDKWEPRLDPPQTLREVWLETPLSEGCIKTLEKLATKYGIEINGLNKCAALYDALLPEDWAGSPWSRKDI
ncbi:hypothetical protein K523DRAFT_319508 [Schizophyllum commune Tattone D]|nr:hypothetical protein K523DRAFT_319508 [Schizophyllum commune Tattone D]